VAAGLPNLPVVIPAGSEMVLADGRGTVLKELKGGK
jgi:hypothetical protein